MNRESVSSITRRLQRINGMHKRSVRGNPIVPLTSAATAVNVLQETLKNPVDLVLKIPIKASTTDAQRAQLLEAFQKKAKQSSTRFFPSGEPALIDISQQPRIGPLHSHWAQYRSAPLWLWLKIEAHLVQDKGETPYILWHTTMYTRHRYSVPIQEELREAVKRGMIEGFNQDKKHAPWSFMGKPIREIKIQRT